MNINEFKKKLDNRELSGLNSKETWDAAYKWLEEVNEKHSSIKWKWDCGFKLDYDGEVCSISSRFYPPNKSYHEYGKYHGTISLMIGDELEEIHTHDIEAETLDELQKITEDYVSKIVDKIHKLLRSNF